MLLLPVNFNSESAVGFTVGLIIGFTCSGTSLTWMLRGTSMRTGPGLPLCAIWKAEAIISGEFFYGLHNVAMLGASKR